MHWHDPVQFSVIVLLYTPDTTDDRLQMQAAVSISSGRATAAATTQHVYTRDKPAQSIKCGAAVELFWEIGDRDV